MPASLRIAHVTPHPVGSGTEIDRYVSRVAGELARAGHRVVLVAPSPDQRAVREARAALRRGDGIFGEDGAPRVLAVGEVVGVVGPRRRTAPPIDVTRAIERLHAVAGLDVCHVHDPFAPSVPSAALRHSRALNVGSFHLPPERLVSTQVARRVVELVFGRLDARTATWRATAELLGRFFPADYRVVHPGTDEPPARSAVSLGDDRVHLAFVDDEERPALRTFLRALRMLDPAAPWSATVLSARGPSASTPLRASLRERVRFASRLGVHEEALDDGDAGLFFEPRDDATLAAQLARLVGDAGLRRRLAERRPTRSWRDVAGELDAVYAELVARRHDGRGDAAARRRIASRALIDVDLHMHTDHSHDCATPVEVLLATAQAQGLGAIAVTDHNEVSGAFEAAAKAAEYGVKVIVGEEVKTASQGEVIGLFLKEKIPRGLSLEETVARIKAQGGLVYVPHPFDRLHSVPDYEHLLSIVDDVDAIEVYNPRVAIGSFNEEAERFAAKYRVVAGAGSDSHVAQGLGSVRIRMRDFDGPAEFLESLREADIIRRPTSLLYVQALKFLETTALPAPARRARRERRVRRASRKA